MAGIVLNHLCSNVPIDENIWYSSLKSLRRALYTSSDAHWRTLKLLEKSLKNIKIIWLFNRSYVGRGTAIKIVVVTD